MECFLDLELFSQLCCRDRQTDQLAGDQANQKHQMKIQLTWARSHTQQVQAPVKTLAEIQKEEAQKLERQKELEEKKAAQQGIVNNCGIWNNAASQLSWRGNPPSGWGQLFNNSPGNNSNNALVSSSSMSSYQRGTSSNSFWENTPARDNKTLNKSQESALQQSNKNNGSNSDSSTKSTQPVKLRKDQVSVSV